MLWLIVLCLLPQLGQAEEDLSEQDKVLLKDVGALITQGKYQDAGLRLLPLRKRANPHLEVLFLSGQILGAFGQWEAAEKEYRLMLAQNSTLLRPRLELAYTLYRQGKLPESLRNFEQAKEMDGLTSGVQATVDEFITAMYKRKQEWRVALGVVHDSNANQATAQSKFVFTGPFLTGATFTLPQSSLQTPSLGTTLQLDGRNMIGDRWSEYLRVSGIINDYQSYRMDSAYGQLAFGSYGRFIPGLRMEVGMQQFLYQGRTLFRGPMANIEWSIPIGKRATLGLTWQTQNLSYPDFSYMTGWMRGWSVNGQIPLTQTFTASVGVSNLQMDANELPYSNTNDGLEFGATWQPEGWLVNYRRSLRNPKYHGIDPMLGIQRHDFNRSHLLEISRPQTSILDFTPQLLLNSTTNESNSTLMTYRRNIIKLMFNRSF